MPQAAASINSASVYRGVYKVLKTDKKMEEPKRVISDIAEHTGYKLSEKDLDSVEEYTRFLSFQLKYFNPWVQNYYFLTQV